MTAPNFVRPFPSVKYDRTQLAFLVHGLGHEEWADLLSDEAHLAVDTDRDHYYAQRPRRRTVRGRGPLRIVFPERVLSVPAGGVAQSN